LFAVVDVETTGGYASGYNMTEIAIVLTDGKAILDSYSTLLNPQQPIPLNIQTLTGISNEMVADAPLFAEKAEEIKAFLGDHIFVAHNVNFDYSFVKAAFESVGHNYNPKRLCSVRYTRKVIPGLRSYSLKNLCKHFGFINQSAHRAWSDAKVTADIINILYQRDEEKVWEQLVKKNSGEFNLPANLPSQEYHSLPESPGVYYFRDETGKPIYIGKAKNLKKRVSTHFISNKETKRSQAFKREIYHLDFELTGSELLAILLEDHEIRHYWPKYNSAQKNPKKRFGVFAFQGQKGNWSMAANRITAQNGYLQEFHSYNEALVWMQEKVIRYTLNPEKCGFPHTLIPDMDVEKHQPNFEKMLEDLKGEKEQCFIIKTSGRSIDEDGFVYVENGHFAGIGFVPKEAEIADARESLNYLRSLNSSVTTNGVIKRIIGEGKYPTIAI
jgi:DNA polymerase-3 subunit epsilon